MERVFKQKRAAESFASKIRKAGGYASVFAEPVSPHASTRRERSRMRYEVRYEKSGRSILGNPRSNWKAGKWIKASAVRVRKVAGRVVMDIKKAI